MITEKEKAFYMKHGLYRPPSYMGAEGNQGRVLIGKEFENEGYAVLKCGNTELKIGYTVLTILETNPNTDSYYYGWQKEFHNNLQHIICEAMLGGKGDNGGYG